MDRNIYSEGCCWASLGLPCEVRIEAKPCEVRIETSTLRVIVGHHWACLVMTKLTHVLEFSMCTEQALQFLFLASPYFDIYI